VTTRPTQILLLAALLLSAPAGHASDRGAAEPPAPVALCLEAWQEKEAAHGGGELTLFEHSVTQRRTYTVVEFTLGSGEGRVFSAACRIEDGRVTGTY
jgi:hypothetical protein